jgi:periplasmic divalent cation tolerance protein
MAAHALVVFTTCGNADEARELAAVLVEQKLAACVNMIERIASTYRWRGQIEHSQESLLVIKTTAERYAAVERTIRERSSYELPEVLALRAEHGSPSYLEWVAGSVEAD